ncbi:MAG: spore coat protein [Firmicutes bacterium]|nr:spore coat protein [Bacillota bacterium]
MTQMLTDKEILTDCLVSQKRLAHDYLACADHTDDPQLLQVLMNLSAEEQQTRLQIFQAMQQRGWYNPQPISPQQVQQAQHNFSQAQQQLYAQSHTYGTAAVPGSGQGHPSWAKGPMSQ